MSDDPSDIRIIESVDLSDNMRKHARIAALETALGRKAKDRSDKRPSVTPDSDADESEDEDEAVKHGRDLKAEACSLLHLLTHFPKNP